MKWFMHEGNARSDSKIEKLLIKYGVEGYGLYFYCVEIILFSLPCNSFTYHSSMLAFAQAFSNISCHTSDIALLETSSSK